MNSEQQKVSRRINVTLYIWSIMLIWTCSIATSFVWNFVKKHKDTLEIARGQAEVTLEKDMLYRRWNSAHGGVYVPATEDTPPNPYLKVPNRDIAHPSGTRLTLINPAYMTRQVNEMAKKEHGPQGHITSLNPIRPENVPDQWETEALKAFEGGLKEVTAVEKLSGDDHMRIMRVFVTEQGCLKCHASQGYKVGDIRGGISVSIPMKPLLAVERTARIRLLETHGFLWMIGLLVIGLGGRFLEKNVRKIEITESALRYERDRARVYLDIAGVMLLVIGNDHLVKLANHKTCDVLGYKEEEIIGKNWFDTFLPERANEEAIEIFAQLMSGEVAQVEYIENFVLTKNREERIIAWHNTIIRDEEGNITGSLSSGEDITEQRKMEELLKESETRFRVLAEESFAGVYTIQNGVFTYVNRKFAEIHGYTIEEMVGRMSPLDTVFPDDIPIVEENIQKRLSGKVDKIHYTFRALRKDGEILNIEIYGSQTILHGNPAVIGTAIDITERIKMEEAVHHMAYHDALTGLPNRLLFNDRLNVAMNLSRRKDEKLAVMMLDLDKFKEVNDSLGHDFGDMLLVTVAERIGTILRKSDTVARMGGDEFMILLPEIAKTEDVITVAEKICLAVKQPMQSNSNTLNTSASIGISIYPDCANDITTLLKYADIALYSAKEKGRNKAVLFPGQGNIKKEVLK